MAHGLSAFGDAITPAPVRDLVAFAPRREPDGDDSDSSSTKLERASPGAAGSPEVTRHVTPAPQARVLVVDDDEGVRRQLSYLLEDEGYAVEVVATGAAALAAARASSFDIVILDVRLPDVSGIEVFESFRKSSGSIKTIIVSGFLVDEEIAAAEGRGAHFLAKPVDAGRLLKLLAMLERTKGDAP